MDTVQALGSAMGLGLLAGIRLYATVFAAGLAIRLGWLDLTPALSQLSVLADTRVLVVSGAACLLEFLADKIPWVDSAWDAVHTFIRPVGAMALGFTALGNFDPGTQMMLSLLAGGVAFTGHSSKAAGRLMANHSPEPFSNIALSLAEDLMVPAGLWIVFEHPLVAVTVVVLFLAFFAWLSPKIIRRLRISWTALSSIVRRFSGQAARELHFEGSARWPEGLRNALETHALEALPEPYRKALQGRASLLDHAPAALHCAAAQVPGLRGSTGYLCLLPSEAVFVCRRLFRYRAHSIPLSSTEEVRFGRGIFLNRLTFVTGSKEQVFDLFKGPSGSAPSTAPLAAQRP